MGFGVWGLGFGVWGLELGVWGLGFGVWGLGFGVYDIVAAVRQRQRDIEGEFVPVVANLMQVCCRQIPNPKP